MMKQLILLAALSATPATAHIVLSPATAAPGSYYGGALRVGHGCGTAATTVLTVTIPAGATDAKPQPKPGWTIDIVRDGGRVTTLRWTGRLEPDQFDAFGVLLKLDPAAKGPLYLPVVQGCGTEERRWTAIPAPGAAWTSVPNPAPVLRIEP